MNKVHFTKSYKTPAELVEILKERNFDIKDSLLAESYIKNIGYYRLSAYMYPFLEFPKTNHTFKTGTDFGQIIRIYSFDKKLRLFLFNEIEKIEIAVRESILNITSEVTGDIYWLTTETHFRNRQIFIKTKALLANEYEKSTEDFIEHFKQTYTEPFPPAWIIGELLPMGSINMYYRNLKDKSIKKRIAKVFHVHAPVFESWLSVLTLTRNACCHHSRIWNKVNKIVPNDIKNPHRPWITKEVDKRKIYYNLCIVKYFLDIISPNNDLLKKLLLLLSDFPEIDIKAMGFPTDWLGEPLWQKYK